MNEKSCGNCVNCEKYPQEDGSENWWCENYYYGVGMPYGVNPPNDGACPNWSEDPKDKDKAADIMRHFVDHFWDSSKE